MEEKYSGDIILISRMIEYFPQKSFEWNANEPITLDDVQFAINHHLSEMAIPFGDTFKYPPKETNLSMAYQTNLIFCKSSTRDKKYRIR